ncbi:MAG: endonuclease/exonuclease/phosphatase family protein [Pseudomonadota bacterium]
MQLIWGLIALLVVALGMSFLGALHGLGDSLAVFRIALCLPLLALGLALRGAGLGRVVVLCVALAGIASVVWHKLPRATPGPVTIYQKNVFHSNAELAGLAADILQTKADFVTLQEVSVANEALLDLLSEAYPHQTLCRYTERSGVAVLSRLEPVEDGPCERRYGMARITVDLAGGRYHVAALHLSWPFPGQQPRQLRRLLNDLERLDYPILIGGDFNMVPWSNALARVARASGTERAGPARTTFLLGSVPISIDHIFAPGGGWAEARPLFGGDHFGILARVHHTPVQNN